MSREPLLQTGVNAPSHSEDPVLKAKRIKLFFATFLEMFVPHL